MKWQAEYTDTFGGEANYAWVRRRTIEMPEGASDYAVVKAAKKALELSGVPCRRMHYSGDDTITLRPVKSNTILFITPLVNGEEGSGE